MAKSLFNVSDHFGLAVGMGLISGVSSVVIQGNKPSPPQDTEVDMVPFTDAYVFPPEVGEEMELVSSNAGDTGQTVLISGLDSDGVEKTEPHTTAGLTPVPIGAWSAINSMTNMGPLAAQADLSIVVQTVGGAGNTYAAISAKTQTSGAAVFTVPAGKRIFALSVINTMEKASGPDTGAVINIYIIAPGSTLRVGVFASGLQRSGDTSPEFNNPLPGRGADPGTRIVATVEASAAGASFLTRIPNLLVEA